MTSKAERVWHTKCFRTAHMAIMLIALLLGIISVYLGYRFFFKPGGLIAGAIFAVVGMALLLHGARHLVRDQGPQREPASQPRGHRGTALQHFV